MGETAFRMDHNRRTVSLKGSAHIHVKQQASRGGFYGKATGRPKIHKEITRSATMGIKLYYTTVTASRDVKSQQAEMMRILESKSIEFELIDISVGLEVRNEMRNKAGDLTAVPPQLFNDDQYCGNYEMFSDSVEANAVEEFLKLV
ncbi:hypothetical protein NHX12_023734 [Muraenolepis orangiensis]|uniref:SH3 domain-binding glutamic acid-rich-like protein 3 n=1 Tax=Muraenolepis orangiensis TaxID=630683 RepID=A0A9Q0EKW3_9TELE|nr:hypothetical protein NHX12_023734 [Muraenolepis orangiensis]